MAHDDNIQYEVIVPGETTTFAVAAGGAGRGKAPVEIVDVGAVVYLKYSSKHILMLFIG